MRPRSTALVRAKIVAEPGLLGGNTSDIKLPEQILNHPDEVSENIKHAEKSIIEKLTNEFSDKLVTIETKAPNVLSVCIRIMACSCIRSPSGSRTMCSKLRTSAVIEIRMEALKCERRVRQRLVRALIVAW